MTTIRRANHYVSYFIALVISGLFSLVGRPGPSWAQDAKGEHDAKIFNEMFQVAQATGQTQQGSSGKSSADARTQQPSKTEQAKEKGSFAIGPNMPGEERGSFAIGPNMPGGERGSFAIGPNMPAEDRISLNGQANAILNGLSLRLKNKETLTPEEIGIIISAQNAAKVDELSNQLNLLLMMVNELQNKLKDK